MKRLSIEPSGGLCNRIRGINSALDIARRLESPLSVYWYRGPECNCRFEELFEIPNGVEVHERDSAHVVTRLLRRGIPFWTFLHAGRFMGQEDVALHLRRGIDLIEIARRRPLYLVTCSSFTKPDNPICDFVPIHSIRQRIKQVVGGFDQFTLGVHIRRTDNMEATRRSPTAAFVAIMQDEIAREPGTRFFVASDDPGEDELIERLFPGRIIIYKKRSLDRNDPLAIQEAVVDLFCLASTRKIIGSSWSSFTKTAARIGVIEAVFAGWPKAIQERS